MGEFFRDGAAESFAGSSDDGDPACESQIHSSTFYKSSMVSRNGRGRQRWLRCEEIYLP